MRLGDAKDPLHHRIRAELDEAFRLTAVADGKAIEQAAERQVMLENQPPQFAVECTEVDLDGPVFHRQIGGFNVQHHLASISLRRVFAMQHFEDDFTAPKGLKPRSHVAVMDEQPAVRFRHRSALEHLVGGQRMPAGLPEERERVEKFAFRGGAHT